MAAISGVRQIVSIITIQGLLCVHFCEMIQFLKPESAKHKFQDHRNDISSVFIPYNFAQNHDSHNEFQVKDYRNKVLTRIKRRLNTRNSAMNGRRVPTHFSTIISVPDEMSNTNAPLPAVCEDKCQCVISGTKLICDKPNTLTRIPKLKDPNLAHNIRVM